MRDFAGLKSLTVSWLLTKTTIPRDRSLPAGDQPQTEVSDRTRNSTFIALFGSDYTPPMNERLTQSEYEIREEDLPVRRASVLDMATSKICGLSPTRCTMSRNSCGRSNSVSALLQIIDHISSGATISLFSFIGAFPPDAEKRGLPGWDLLGVAFGASAQTRRYRRAVRARSPVPVLLAGGLRRNNVAQAIATVRPLTVSCRVAASIPEG